MKGVKNYLKNVTKSIAYTAASVGKDDLMPNVGSFVDSNKEFLASTYSVIKNPKAYVKGQVNAFKDSKVYQAIDYGARNIFDDLKSGKFYNKERADRDSLKFAGSAFDVDNWDDLSEFGIDNDWENNLDKGNQKDEITTGDIKIIDSIESSNRAVANTTASAIAAAAESNNKNSRINTSMLYSQNERLFSGVHTDMSVLNATMDSIHKVVVQALPNIDKNMASYFSEASKDRKEIIAMMKESLEIQRKTAVDQEKIELEKRRKNGKLTWNDINNGGMPDLSAYLGQVKKNIKRQLDKGGMGGMASMMGEDSNMLAAMMSNPLGLVMETITKSLVPAGIKMATKELDKSLSSVFGTFIGKMANASNKYDGNPILSALSKILGIDTSVNKNIDSSKYYKGAVPFDGITRKAIVDIIPTYLRRIEAAITKQEEQIYDYDKASWKNVRSVKSDIKDIRKNAIKSATSDLMNDMNKGLNYVKSGFKSSSNKKEFSEAVWEFREYLYDHNGVINAKVSPEANDITSYGQYSKLYKYYPEIMTVFMNMDFDKKSGRHRNLSGKMISNQVLSAKADEEKQYRNIESQFYSAMNQVSEKGARFNMHGKFKGDNKDRFTANNMLLQMKDSLGNNMFDYMQKIAGELRFLRMDLASGVGVISGAVDGNTNTARAGQVLYDSGDYDLKKVLINKSFNNDNIRKIMDQSRRDAEDRAKTESKIRSGKAVDHDYRDINSKDYIEQIAYGVSSIATKDYEDNKKELANENFISKYMNKKYYDPKLAKELSKLYNRTDKEIKQEEKKEDKTESATDSLLRKARQARARFQAIIGAPAEIFENLLYTADRAVYDMMFKAEVKDEDDKDNPEGAKGFMNLIAKKVNKVLDKVSTKAHEDIIDPLMRRLGIDDPKKFKEDTKDAFTNIGGQLIKKFLEANKEVYGDIYNRYKSQTPEARMKATKNRINADREKRENLKNNPEILRTRRAAMKAMATGKYTFQEQFNDVLNTVEERKQFLLDNGLIDANKLDYYSEDAINKAYIRYIQKTHAKGTMTPNGKPFKGLSTLHAGEAIFNSKGSGIINKTGLYNITEPTHILNRYDTNSMIGIKNNKSRRSTIASDLADEKKLQRNIFHHPQGTENTKDKNDKTEENINKAINAVQQKYRDVKDIDYNSVKENVKLHLPEGLAGGAVGGIASTLLGIVGGPLIGALLGSAAGVISSSDSLKNQLFGTKDANGKRNGGKLFGDKIMGFINKYAPDMSKYGLAGIIPGLITPLGPLGGMLVGAGIGFLKNNDKFMDKYFGQVGADGKRLGGKLSIDSQSKGILKKILPGGLKGAGAGALAGLVFGGPFGLLGNAAIGTAVGMITSTDAFKDNILGKMKDGVREGGLVGEIRRAFDPLKQSAQKIGKDMLTVFDKYVVDPLSRFIDPFINQLYLGLSYIPKKIDKMMEEKIGKPIQAFFVDKVLRRFNKAFGWIGKRASGAFKGIASTFLNPFNILGAAGDVMKTHQIKIGDGVAKNMTASERMEWMARKTKRKKNESDKAYQARVAKSYKQYGRDAALASIGTKDGLDLDQAKSLRRKLQQVTDTDKHLDAARKQKAKDIQNSLRHWVRNGSDAKISPKALDEIYKALKTDNLDLVEKILSEWDLVDTKRGESRIMTDEEIQSIMNGRNGKSGVSAKLSEFKDLTRRKKLLGKLNKSGNRKSITEDLVKRMNKSGFNIKDASQFDEITDLINTEIVNREANKKVKGKTEDKKIIDNNELAEANAENTKKSAEKLDGIYKLLIKAFPTIKDLGDLSTLDSENENLKRNRKSSLTNGRAYHIKTNAKYNVKYVKNAALGRHKYNNTEDEDIDDTEPEATAAGTIIPMNGLGSLLWGGIKKIGSTIGSFVNGAKKGKRTKAQRDIGDAAGANGFGIANLNDVDAQGDGKSLLANPQTGDVMAMKKGSDGQVEPDTSDSKTKEVMNKIAKRDADKAKLDQAQLRQSEVIDEAFSDQQQDGKKMKWWQLILYGIVAAPFIKKLFTNFLKPLWNDKLKPALGKLWEEKLLPGITSAITGITTFLVENVPTFITNLTDALTKIDWKKLIFGTADAGGAFMDAVTGNKNNAGASNTMSKEDFNNATGNSHLTDDTGREVTYEDIRNGNYQGQLRNEQGDVATINSDGSLTVKDGSKHGSSYLKKELNGMFHAAIRHNPGRMTTRLSKAAGKILKKKGLTNKIVGLAGKAITEPIKFAAHPVETVKNAGKAVNNALDVTGKVQKASDFIGNVKDRIVNRAAYKQGSAMEYLINTTDTITENGVKKGSKIATIAGKIKGGINNAGSKVTKGIKSSKAATKIAEASGAVSSKIAKILESVEGVVQKLFSNSKVAKKLADCAETVGKSADNFISAFKDKVVTVFKNGIKKGGNKVEKSTVSKVLGKVGSFVGKALGVVTVILDFLTGCDKAESILGVKETSIVEEVVSGIINALCNFFIIPAIVPGVNWIARLLMGFFNKDLKSRQADADAELEAYNTENHTNYSKEEYLEMTKSVTGKVKIKAKETLKTAKGGVKKAWGAVKGAANSAGSAIKKGVSGAIDAAKESADNTWKNVTALPSKVSKLFGYAKSGDLKSFYGYKAADNKTIGGRLANNIVGMAKLPLSFVALPGSIISIIKNHSSEIIGTFKDISGSIGKLFEYAKSGDLKSFYSYSAVDEKKSISSKIANVIGNIAKVPMSFLALPAAAIKTIKNKFSDIMNGMMQIKDNNDKVIDKAMDGDISVFSSDYWSVSNTQNGFAGGLETVYDYIMRITKAPFILVANAFSNLKKWFDDKIDWMKEKVGDIQKFFDDPVGYFKDAATDAGKAVANKASSAWGAVKGAASSAASTVAGWFGGGKYGRGYDKQNDPSIANIRFNAPGDTEYQTIGDSGCGPAAAVSAIKSAYGRGANDIVNASKYAISNGYKEKNGGTKPGFFKDYFNKNGLDSSMTYDKSAIKKNIKSGQPTVLMGSDPNSNGTPYGPNPHYVTVTGVDGRGNAIVQDPESNGDNQTYNMNKLLKRSNFGVSVTGRGKLPIYRGSGYRYGRGNLENMHIGQNGIDLICQFEGFMATAYHGKGEQYLTIGYGHYGPDVQSGQTITEEQAKQLLARDASSAETWVKKYVRQYSPGFEPNQNQFDALVSYVYNRGCGAAKELFVNSKTAADYSNNIVRFWGKNAAAKKGLQRRRAAEQALFNSNNPNAVAAGGYSSSDSGSSDTSNPLDNISSILGQTKAGKALSIFTGLFSGGNSDSSSTSTGGSTSGDIGAVNAVAPSQAAEAATKQMEEWAADDTHGYSQANRWGNPDFDCSSSVISAWTKVGVDVKGAGASCTRDMYDAFIKMGFTDVINQINLSTGDGLQRGDVLLSSGSHTAMYCGNGKIVHASSSRGNSQPGDQSGTEFLVAKYYNKPWNHVLRYKASGKGSGKYGQGKGYSQSQVAKTVYGLGKAVAAVSGKSATNSYKSYSKSIRSTNNSKVSIKDTTNKTNAYNNALSNPTPTKRSMVRPQSSGTNYNQLLNVVIEILTSIADNTDKLNVIVELLNEKLGTNISSKEVSQKAMNKESIKSKIRKALYSNNTGDDTAGYYGDINTSHVTSIINTMNAIASE